VSSLLPPHAKNKHRLLESVQKDREMDFGESTLLAGETDGLPENGVQNTY
jgi:hypothetical protein